MTLSEAKELLDSNNIPYDCVEYENENEFLFHIASFSSHTHAQPYKIITLVIRSNNSKTHIELVFTQTDDDICFEELFFGAFGFELFDFEEAAIAEKLVFYIKAIMDGCFGFFVVYDMKHQLLKDFLFDLRESRSDYDAMLPRIQKTKSFLAKLILSKKQYELYDWNTYHTVIK